MSSVLPSSRVPKPFSNYNQLVYSHEIPILFTIHLNKIWFLRKYIKMYWENAPQSQGTWQVFQTTLKIYCFLFPSLILHYWFIQQQFTKSLLRQNTGNWILPPYVIRIIGSTPDPEIALWSSIWTKCILSSVPYCQS